MKLKHTVQIQKVVARSLPVRGAWIEIDKEEQRRAGKAGSLPVRGAWIEMGQLTAQLNGTSVAPRAGSVD